MSDSRFHLKGEFRIYGKTFPFDMSLNWYSHDTQQIDERITIFFLHSHDEARMEWLQDAAETRAQREAEDIERNERAELERLRAKYAHNKGGPLEKLTRPESC